MEKRGPKPKKKVKIEWSPEFAYAIGLITTDGNLSPDRRHINFTTKDRELAEIFKRCLKITNAIGRKARSYESEKKYFCLQFGDVIFYAFLESIGIMPCKSKTSKEIKIPNPYFFDFLRGHFDGDGTFYSYWDPRWKSSFMFYTELVSASKEHVMWLQGQISRLLGIKGRITKSKNNSVHRLKFAKAESLKLLRRMYYNSHVVCLSRKRLKVEKALREASSHL